MFRSQRFPNYGITTEEKPVCMESHQACPSTVSSLQVTVKICVTRGQSSFPKIGCMPAREVREKAILTAIRQVMRCFKIYLSLIEKKSKATNIIISWSYYNVASIDK